MFNKNFNTTVFSFFLSLLSILHFSIASCQNVPTKTFQAGAAQTDITPPKGSKLLGGRQIHDTLHAKSLVLDDGDQKMIFVVADNQGIPAFVCDATRQKIHELTNIPISNILISATHTHTGIVANPAPINLNKNGGLTEYQSIISDKIVESVQKAINNLQPAQIGWSQFDKPEYVFNRRWYLKKPATNPFGLRDSVKMNPGFDQQDNLDKPAGPTDPEVYFIAVRSTAGSPIAILANYSVHYVGGAAPKSVSADYYGEFGKQLADLLDVKENEIPFVGIMSNGTSGDISHNNYLAAREKRAPYEAMTAVAKDLAQNVINKYNQIEFHDWVPLHAKESQITLKFRRPTQEVSNNISKITQSQQKATLFNKEEKAYARRVNNLVTQYPEETTFPLQTFSIGDLAIASVPFEVFAETGLELKEQNPFKESFTIGLANGHWGYLPTPAQHKKGGYETWISVSRVQEDASDIIAKELLKQFNELKEL